MCRHYLFSQNKKKYTPVVVVTNNKYRSVHRVWSSRNNEWPTAQKKSSNSRHQGENNRQVTNGEKKKKTVAERYGISQSSLSTILKLKDSIIATVSASGSSTAKKNLKTAAYVNVEKALLVHRHAHSSHNIPVYES
ncbi:unnamed protein product [Ixodes persulcatus]